jgi:SAM-dependent methyltransferase
MIEIAARRTAADLPISWRVDDAEHLKTFAAASFDGVTCQLGLMDIADLMATLRSVRRVLRPRGWFVFVIGHPCSLAPLATTRRDDDGRLGRFATRYFDEEFWISPNPHGIRGRAGNHHRPLGVYLNSLLAAGFRLDAVEEPRATPLLVEQQPVFRSVPSSSPLSDCHVTRRRRRSPHNRWQTPAASCHFRWQRRQPPSRPEWSARNRRSERFCRLAERDRRQNP